MPDHIRLGDILITESTRSPGDTWTRQQRTAEAIDARFRDDIDTVLLADEVGMGKTYVALSAMAHYLHQSKTNDRKVLLVTPPSNVLRVKWQQEIQSFNEHYMQPEARARKDMRAVVIRNYWDLLRNLADYRNHEIKRAHDDDRRCFTWCMFNWAHERLLLGKERRIVWKCVADLDLRSPTMVNFLAHYSAHAIWSFLDDTYRREEKKLKDLFIILKNDWLDERPAKSGGTLYGKADIANLFKSFAAQQDAFEPNIYIISMNALTRPRIDQHENQLLSKYLLSHLLFRRHADTWKTHAQVLVEANVLTAEFADKHSHRWRLYMESMATLACGPFYGLKDAVKEVVDSSEVQKDWKPLSAAILHGDASGAQAFFADLGDRVFAAQLARAHMGLAIVDEVHNWKGGNFGASAFRANFAPGIANKLIMSATPFQMEEGEMQRVFGFVQSSDGGSQQVMQALYAADGEVARCLAASAAFGETWQSLSAVPDEAQRLHEIFAPANLISVDQIAAATAASPLEAAELRNFCRKLLDYRQTLLALQSRMGKVVVRHTKCRDKRHFHIGEHFQDSGVPSQSRTSLYPARGHASDADALVNFIGMRLGQLALRESKESFEGNARLLGGLTSSTNAFRESACRSPIPLTAQAYAAMFERILDQSTHPKVAATVARAFSNYEAGRKTLIFCERVATLRELEQALTTKIDGFIAAHGASAAIERQNLLKRREVLENLWWHSLWEALGQRATGADLLADYLSQAEAFAASCLRKTRIHPSPRRIINLLDTWLIGHATAIGLVPASDWTPALTIIAALAQQLEAELQQEEFPTLREFLAPRRDTRDTSDPANATGNEDDDAGEAKEDDAIIKAVEVVGRQQYRERHNLWLMGDATHFHALLWQVLGSEARQLQSERPGMATTDPALQAAPVFIDILDDIMTGMRKITLRDDLLVLYERASPSGTSLERVAEGLYSMRIGHDPSMLARVTRFLDGLIAADGSISSANLAPSRRKSLWQGVSIGKIGHVATLDGSTPAERRSGLCAAFNSPLLPDILICTAIGSEGIDLHRQCADVIHHDLPWNPAKLEQRNGRVDRVGSIAQVSNNMLIHLGIPFLANNYEEYQYKKVYSRAQKFEVLMGRPEFERDNIDEEHYADDGEETIIEAQSELSGLDVVMSPLPPVILDALRLDLSVN